MYSKRKKDKLILKWMYVLQAYFIHFPDYFLINQVNYLFTDLYLYIACAVLFQEIDVFHQLITHWHRH